MLLADPSIDTVLMVSCPNTEYMLRPSDHTLYDDTLTDLLSMIIDSVKVAAKEIVVSLRILPSHSPSLPESIVRQVV